MFLNTGQGHPGRVIESISSGRGEICEIRRWQQVSKVPNFIIFRTHIDSRMR